MTISVFLPFAWFVDDPSKFQIGNSSFFNISSGVSAASAAEKYSVLHLERMSWWVFAPLTHTYSAITVTLAIGLESCWIRKWFGLNDTKTTILEASISFSTLL
jgi:hypothetical protein